MKLLSHDVIINRELMVHLPQVQNNVGWYRSEAIKLNCIACIITDSVVLSNIELLL